MEEYKFGVCNYDWNGYNAKPQNLTIYDSYIKAYQDYTQRLDMNNPLWINPDLWIVWIRKSDNKIEQFERLTWSTHCRLVEIPNESN